MRARTLREFGESLLCAIDDVPIELLSSLGGSDLVVDESMESLFDCALKFLIELMNLPQLYELWWHCASLQEPECKDGIRGSDF